MKEKHKRWLAFIFFLLFFVIAYHCSSQVQRIHRYSKHPEITTIIPELPMRFNAGNDDTIFVSISADSLEDYYDVKVFVFFPKSKDIKGYMLEIGFTNGKAIKLTSDLTIPKHGYSEFYLTEDELELLKNNKFDYIAFCKDNVIEPCVNIRTKDFFCNFLHNYKN